MKDLRNWLSTKDYSEGIDLLKKYSKNNQETEFLAKFATAPQKMHVAIMHKRIFNILRINEQTGIKPEIKPAITIEQPISIKKIHYTEVEKKLEQRKELTNKLLAYNWIDLSKKEQEYFKNNPQVFAGKKELLIANSKIESELKSTHASLKHAKNDKERKQIAEKLVNLKNEQTQNWKAIDNFEITEVKKVEKKEESTFDKFKLLQKRNNLRSQRTKLKNKIQDTDHPNHKEWMENYNEVIAELDKIEKML